MYRLKRTPTKTAIRQKYLIFYTIFLLKLFGTSKTVWIFPPITAATAWFLLLSRNSRLTHRAVCMTQFFDLSLTILNEEHYYMLSELDRWMNLQTLNQSRLKL